MEQLIDYTDFIRKLFKLQDGYFFRIYQFLVARIKEMDKYKEFLCYI